MHPMPELAPSTYTPPTPGTVLASRYRIEESLGSGGMADVFRAVELGSGRSVAVKVLRTSPEQSPEATARLRREGQVLRSLKHPAIVAIEEVTEIEGGRVMLVMEMLRGETLGARMRRGRLEPAELAPIVAGTAAGLATAHANGVVHRDLKPDNIFLCAGADGRVQVKLLDFGVSKVFGGERLTQTGQVLGTPRYMSPEQLGAEPEVDHRVDIYSLGVIVYEALAGKPPFLAGTPTDLIVAILHGKMAPLRSHRPDLPAAIEAVVMRAMARVRDARFRAATEMADAFLDAAGVAPGAVARPRAGMATTPLGSLRTLDPALAAAPQPSPPAPARPAPSAAPDDALTPGTFSAMPAFDEDEIRRAAGAAPGVTTSPQGSGVDPAIARAMAQTALAPSPGALDGLGGPAAPRAVATAPATDVAPRAREIPRTAISTIEPVPPPVAEARRVQPPPADLPGNTSPIGPPVRAPVPSSAPGELLEPRPRRRGTVVLAFIGLAAGALSAGIAVVVLGFMGVTSHGGGTHAPPPPPLASSDAGAGTDADDDDAIADAGTPGTAEVTPTDPPPTTTGAHHHGAHHSRPDGTTPPPTTTTAVTHTTPAPDPHTDPLGAAQRALSDGSAAECVEILSGLITGGGTPIALRRRGDCLMRMGRREEAIADYQRFCRIAPDHPAIAEVRETLEGMGRTCP